MESSSPFVPHSRHHFPAEDFLAEDFPAEDFLAEDFLAEDFPAEVGQPRLVSRGWSAEVGQQSTRDATI